MPTSYTNIPVQCRKSKVRVATVATFNWTDIPEIFGKEAMFAYIDRMNEIGEGHYYQAKQASKAYDEESLIQELIQPRQEFQ